MEFHEKLKELRKQKGLTQEEMAEMLYVSRTAVSKWESGRGLPGIESLKSISSLFSVSVDDLLSGDKLLTIAEAESKERERHTKDLVYGLLDCFVGLLLLFPLFGQRNNGVISTVSLLGLQSGIIKTVYILFVACSVAVGVTTLALQSCRSHLWIKTKASTSVTVSMIGVLLFIASQQPYAAVFVFTFLMIKLFMAIKTR